MKQSLLTPSELIDFADLPKDFPPCEVSRIATVEKTVFRECVGSKLYGSLKDNLATYEAAQKWTEGEHEKDAVVIYKGVVMKATTTTTKEPPHPDWSMAPKFDKECLERLWCEVLGEYLSYAVLEVNAPLLLSQIKHGSIVKILGQNFEGGSKWQLESVVKSLKTFKELAFDNLVAFVKDNNEDGCYDGFKLCVGCKQRKKIRRGWDVA